MPNRSKTIKVIVSKVQSPERPENRLIQTKIKTPAGEDRPGFDKRVCA